MPLNSSSAEIERSRYYTEFTFPLFSNFHLSLTKLFSLLLLTNSAFQKMEIDPVGEGERGERGGTRTRVFSKQKDVTLNDKKNNTRQKSKQKDLMRQKQ